MLNFKPVLAFLVFLSCLYMPVAAQEDLAGNTFTVRQKAPTTLHPDYSLTPLFPKDFPNKIVGMDWLPNGDMAILTLQDEMWPHNGGGHGWGCWALNMRYHAGKFYTGLGLIISTMSLGHACPGQSAVSCTSLIPWDR